MEPRQMSATEFKATCLAVLDEVNQRGGSVNITKRGKVVATLQAVENPGWRSLENALCGQIVLTDDIVSFNTSDDWEVFQRKTPPTKRRGLAVARRQPDMGSDQPASVSGISRGSVGDGGAPDE